MLQRVLAVNARAAAHAAIDHFGRDYDSLETPREINPSLMSVIYSGLAVEWILRFAVADFDPGLISDKNHAPSAIAFARLQRDKYLNPQSAYRSSSMENVIQVFRGLYPNTNLNSAIDTVVNARNQAVHIGFLSQGEFAVLTSMIRIVDTLSLSPGSESFWDRSLDTFIEVMRSPQPEEWRSVLERRLAGARTTWMDAVGFASDDDARLRYIEEHQATIADSPSKAKPNDTLVTLRPCPVDGSDGELWHELMQGAVDKNRVIVGPSASPATDLEAGDVWASPVFFRCFVCGLVIEDDNALALYEDFRPFPWAPR